MGRKVLAAALALGMAFALSACGGGSAGGGAATTAAATQAATEAATQAATQGATQAAIEAVTQGATQAATEAVTQAVAQAAAGNGLEWKDIYMGFCASTTANDIMQIISGAVKSDIESHGGKCDIASADGDAATQIEQVENFVTMGCNVLLIMAVENDALSDAIQKAKDAGVLTLTLSTDCTTQDCYMSSGDEKAMGIVAVDTALEWVKATFDTSETIYGAIIACQDSTEAAYRCTAYDDAKDIFAAAGYTLEILDKQTVTWTYEAGQEAAENIILKYPEINLWLCYNGVIAQGTSEAVMTAAAVPDVSKVGAFCVDCNTDIAELIIASKNNESVLRGAVSTGALSDFAGMPAAVIDLWRSGETVPPAYSLTPFPVTVDTAESFIVEYGE
ncbi:MAG: substrate-binding domain-containing protein [Lachnospiraceae bacterium]|nr:substrate-binding domain-containing protein [Lachnospiraceae bacterium]